MRFLAHKFLWLFTCFALSRGALAAPESVLIIDQAELSSHVWNLDRWSVIAIAVVVALLVLTSLGFLFEHRRFRRAEAQSKERSRQMVHMDRTLIAGAMSASIAHEVNQALGAILANSETARIMLNGKSADVKQLKQILTDIEREDKRAADIIGHLRGLLRERNESDVQVLDLNQTIRSAVELVAPEAKKRKIALAANQEAQKLPVRADPVHLQQVVMKLVLNSMDSMKDVVSAPAIAVRVASIGDAEAEVSVSESGYGIQVEAFSQIDEPFHAAKQGDAGQGLSIARTIVENYGGRIWAENQCTGGSSIRFRLPLAKAVYS